MTTNEQSVSTSNAPASVPGDVVGGVVLALAGIVHLFVLQIGDSAGLFVLLVVWPLLAGAVGTALDHRIRPGRARDLPLVGAVTGVFGAVLTALLVLLAGLADAWSSFIFNTFGVELVPVTLSIAIVLLIFWTVTGYVGGYVVRTAIAE